MPIAAETPEEVVVLPRKLWTRDECVARTLGPPRYGALRTNRKRVGPPNGQEPAAYPRPPLTHPLAADGFWRRFCPARASIDLRPEDQPTSEPEPDALALTLSFLNLEPEARPRPDQLRLVVEVSSSTLTVDRTIKARLYARSGIVEYWILDLEGRRMIVHRDPIDGAYRSIEIYSEQESVSTLAALDRTIRVADLLK